MGHVHTGTPCSRRPRVTPSATSAVFARCTASAALLFLMAYPLMALPAIRSPSIPFMPLHVSDVVVEHASSAKQGVSVEFQQKGNHIEAMRQWRAMAAQGDREAQFSLAVLYHTGGDDVEKDMNEALYWYRKAAEQAHRVAQYDMGVFYAAGMGVARDLNVAAQWWRLAAAQGHMEAQFNLGVFYAEGSGVKQDLGEAVKWWNMAADQGYPPAQFNLGLMYMKGQGVEENPDEAVRWWRLSAEQGFTQAINVLKVFNIK